jgi:hypothetical protein
VRVHHGEGVASYTGPESCACRTAEERDDLAPPNHSITSSASASSLSGMLRPSALAVLILITNSNRIGCWIVSGVFRS